MSDTQQSEKLQDESIIIAAHHAYEAVAALDVLDTYRSLSRRESERVYNFLQDAKRRESEPAEEAAFAVLEHFRLFLSGYRTGEPRERTCFEQDLTPEQYDRYVRVWESLQAVSEEIKALCLAKYGPEAEGC